MTHSTSGFGLDGPTLAAQEYGVPLTTSILHDGDVALLALDGELDLEMLSRVAGAVGQLRADGFRRLVIDLSTLTFCDSSGLGALLRASRSLRADGGRCVVAGARGPVRRLMEVTDIGRVLELEPDVGAALTTLLGAASDRPAETPREV